MDISRHKEYRQFARDLVTTGELDPMYTMLYRARNRYGDDWTAKFCMYFLMFYDSERAAVMANMEPGFFWDYIDRNFDTLTRGKERRHYRGANGRKSFHSLRALGSPTEAFFSVYQATTLRGVYQAKNRLRIMGFGEYFTVKWADYLDTVFWHNINYDELPNMLPKPPQKCLDEVFPGMDYRHAMDIIVSWVSDMDDPFSGRRKCGYSEAETIACAIPTYVIRPVYRMGDDIAKYRKQLRNHPDLLEMLP